MALHDYHWNKATNCLQNLFLISKFSIRHNLKLAYRKHTQNNNKKHKLLLTAFRTRTCVLLVIFLLMVKSIWIGPSWRWVLTRVILHPLVLDTRYLHFTAICDCKCIHREHNGTQNHTKIWFSILENVWQLLIQDVHIILTFVRKFVLLRASLK